MILPGMITMVLFLLIVGVLLVYLVKSRQQVQRLNSSLFDAQAGVDAETGARIEAEQRFDMLFESSAIGLALCRMDGTLIEVNHTYADILGRSVDETLKLSYWDITPRDYADMEQLQLQQLRRSGRYGPYEKEYIHADGHRVQVRLNGTMVERDGESLIWSSVEDISDLKEAIHQLETSERSYRQLVDLIPDAVGIHRDGRWLFVNQAFADVFAAASPNDVVGSAVLDRVHLQDREKVARRIQTGIEQRKKVPLITERLLRFDGSWFWGEVQGRPMDLDGKPAVLVVMRDVDMRMQAEQENRRLLQAVEQSAEPLMLMNPDGVVEMANPAAAALYNLSIDQMTGRYAAELRGGQRGDSRYLEVVNMVNSGQSWCGELEVETGNGTQIIARRVSPVFDEQGRVERQVCIDRNITEEKKQATQLEHTQRLESLGILAGGIAHDFNNILMAIMGNAAIASRSLSDAVPAKMMLKRIEEASHRASDLCKQMLAYSGKGHFVVKPLSLSTLVGEMTRLMEVSIHKDIELSYQLAEQLPMVEADAAQIQQVVLNLITNANEAIGEKAGVITFATGVIDADAACLDQSVAKMEIPQGKYVFIEVSDTGCGMDGVTLEHIFDPFYTTKFTGRGLGMSAVMGIVRGHHGALLVRSEVGQGTTFKLLLPVMEDVPYPGEKRSTASQSACSFEGMVMVVDDEEHIREVATIMLEDLGFEVMTAVNGEEAVELYQQYGDGIGVILLDMTMPKMDGSECFRVLRSIAPHVQVILSSGYSEEDVTSRFAGKGVAGFLQKPYSPEQLQAVLSAVVH